MVTCDDLKLGENGPMRRCQLPECDEPHAAKGYCNRHYHRWRKWGDPRQTYYRDSCVVEDCDKRHLARGWCYLHYYRWKNNGDPLKVERIRGDDERRLWSYVDVSGDCWEWIGGVSSNGYGKFKVNGQTLGAHRVVWERLIGPIGEGLTLDHLCRNRACVNPDHLESVPIKVNIMRGYGAAAQRTRAAWGSEYPW